MGEEGLTIEGWYYFEDTPKLRERWILLHKEGSYYTEYWGPDRPLNVGTTGHGASIVHGKGVGFKDKARGGVAPVHEWIHFGRQFFRSRQMVVGDGNWSDVYRPDILIADDDPTTVARVSGSTGASELVVGKP